MLRWGIALIAAFSFAGCGEGQGPNLEKVEAQPPADLEKARQAKTIQDWAAANPNNGAPGHGDGEK
jgi:hypothetical protein